MNKQELIAKIAEDTGITKTNAAAAVDSFFEGITKSLKKGKPITFDFAAELARYQTDLAKALSVDAARKSGSAERLDVPTETRIRPLA